MAIDNTEGAIPPLIAPQDVHLCSRHAIAIIKSNIKNLLDSLSYIF